MKIALVHIRHSKIGGTERYLDYLASFLAEKGEEVTIICRRHEEKPHPMVSFITLKHLSFGVGNRYIRFAKGVERHLRRHSYDVVFGLGRTYTQDIIRLGGGCHRTYYENVHCKVNPPITRLFKMTFIKHGIYLKLERKALDREKSQLVICNSETVKKDIQMRYGIKDTHIRVIYNGVDSDRFHPRLKYKEGKQFKKDLNIPEEAFTILFLGNGYKRKGLDLLLRIIPTVLKQRPNTYLIVVGHDSQSERYQSFVEKEEIADRVRFLGKRKDSHLCYAASDLYVLPSRYDPFANTTIEAMSAGLPVISTRENGGSELIERHKNGTVIDMKDDCLVDAILYWMDAEKNRNGRICSRKTAEKHSIQSKLEEVYGVIKEAHRLKQ